MRMIEMVKRMARAGEIPGIKLGELWRFRASTFGSYIQEITSRQDRFSANSASAVSLWR